MSFVPVLRRTELLCWFYRALGVRVGRSVVIDTDDLLGHDLITLKARMSCPVFGGWGRAGYQACTYCRSVCNPLCRQHCCCCCCGTLQDGCCLEASSGVTAVSFAAAHQPAADNEEYPLGSMTCSPVVVGEWAVVGPHAMVVHGEVQADAVVEPCSATSSPCAAPKAGAEALATVRTLERPVGVLPGLLAMVLASMLVSLAFLPAGGGYHDLLVHPYLPLKSGSHTHAVLLISMPLT
jgi:hypothetical protein